MLKNLFSKKSEDKEEPKEGKDSAPRPKIVIKQRRPSNAPLPNGIANAMSPHSMPREDTLHNLETRPQHDYSHQEEVNPTTETDEASARAREEERVLPSVDISPYEAEIAALKTEKAQLQEKTMSLVEEARGLHAALDTLEKTSIEEISNLKETIEVQQRNYSALEDEFLQQKEDLDELQDQLEQLSQDHETILNELEDLQSISVPKKDLLSAQAKLREEIHRKEDFENQTIALKKDQARYETMVTELSAHITELKDSIDKGADEQMHKLMEVKDQELSMKSERIEELEKVLKEHRQEKKQFQQLLNDKESLIETYQEYEEKYIDAQEAVQELHDAFQELQASHLVLEDQLSLKTTDLENVNPKIFALEQEITELKANLESTSLALQESETLRSKLQLEFDETTKEWDAEKERWELRAASASSQHSDYQSTISSLTEEKKALEAATKELATQVQEKTQRIELVDTENETLSAQLAEKEAIINSNLSIAENARDEKEALTKEIADLNSQLESLQELFAVEKEQLENQISELRAESTTIESDDEDVIEALRLQIAENEVAKQEKLEEEQALRDQIAALTSQLDDMKAVSDDLDKIKEFEQKYYDAEKREQDLLSEIELLKEPNKGQEEFADDPVLTDVRQKYNDALKREESLLLALESLEAKYNSLKGDLEESNSKVEEVEKTEVDENEILQLRNTVQELEKEQESLHAKILELEALNQQLLENSEEEVLVDSAPGSISNYVINLVMKPDNDEYELELPGNMNGREIKTELTEAGLLEEGKSYDLFLPKQDAYIMNDEMLANFKISQGETLEIIPG